MPPFLVGRIKLLASALWCRLGGREAPAAFPRGSLSLPGLAHDVWITRDDVGVPQIQAETERDLAFGLGVTMAQDRLWQMEMLRRLAGGCLTELLGDHALAGPGLHLPRGTLLAADQFYRGLRMHKVALEERLRLSPVGQEALEGLAAGVNAWLACTPVRELPLEFLLLGRRPRPWTPEDSLAIGKLMGWMLSLAFPAKPVLASLAADPALRSLLPPDLAQGQCILSSPFPAVGASLDLLARQALGLSGAGVGSNNWVVAGERTASGKPLLCNDPHLVFSLPALWYPAALVGPAHRTIGATLPGIPGVLMGRNEHLAWGFTAVMADDGDYYRETLDGAGSRYLRGGNWLPVEVVEETFHVRGRRAPVRLALRFVRHEGVLCPLLPQTDGEPPTSFRWVGLEPWRSLEAILGMNRAADLGEFENAAREFAVPAQNIVVADRKGGIAYLCAGRFPRRAWAGQAPFLLDGTSPSHAWGGYLAWAEQPRVVSPPAGFLATANNRVAPELPPTLAVGFWEPPYRAARIGQLLRACRQARVADMAQIQRDVFSLQAAGILARLIRPVAERLQDERARQAADLLLAWDCRMEADSAAAAFYHLFYQAIVRRCFQPALDRCAPGLFRRYFSLLHLAVPATDRALLRGDAAWFPQGEVEMVEASLVAAWEEARRRLGPDPGGWRWGTLHTLTFAHGLGRGSRTLRALAWLLGLNRGPYPRPGDGMTINLGAFSLADPFGIQAGPGYRQIVDLGDPEASSWIVAGGVSGDPRSPHYADQLSAWLRGELRAMRFQALTRDETGDALHLVPGG